MLSIHRRNRNESGSERWNGNFLDNLVVNYARIVLTEQSLNRYQTKLSKHALTRYSAKILYLWEVRPTFGVLRRSDDGQRDHPHARLRRAINNCFGCSRAQRFPSLMTSDTASCYFLFRCVNFPRPASYRLLYQVKLPNHRHRSC